MRKTPLSMLAVLLLAQLVCGFQPVPFLPRRGGKHHRQRRHEPRPLRIFPNHDLFPPSPPDQTTAALTLLGSGASTLLAFGVDSSTFNLMGTIGMGMLIASSIVLREIAADKATIFLPKPKMEPSPPKEMPPWEILTMQAELLKDGSLKRTAAEPLSLPASMENMEEQAEFFEEVFEEENTAATAAVENAVVAALSLPPPTEEEEKVDEPVFEEKEIDLVKASAALEPETTEKEIVDAPVDVDDHMVATEVLEDVVDVEDEEAPVLSSFEAGAAIEDEFLNAADEEEPLPADYITGIPYVSDSLVDVVEDELESYEEEDSLIVDPLVLEEEEDVTDDLLDNPFLYAGGWEEGDEEVDESDDELVSDALVEEEAPEASYFEDFAIEEEEEEEEPVISGVPYVSDSLVDVVEEGLEIVREEHMSVDPLFYAEEPAVALGDEVVKTEAPEKVEEAVAAVEKVESIKVVEPVEVVGKEVEAIVPEVLQKAVEAVVEKVEAATIVEDVAPFEKAPEVADAIVEPELVEDVAELAAAPLEPVIEPDTVEKMPTPPRPEIKLPPKSEPDAVPEPAVKKQIVDPKFDEVLMKVQDEATARTKERLKLAVDTALKAAEEMEALGEEASAASAPQYEAPPVNAFEDATKPTQAVSKPLSNVALKRGEKILEKEEARVSDRIEMKLEKQEKKPVLRFLKNKRGIVGAAAAIVVARRLIVTILRNGML